MPTWKRFLLLLVAIVGIYLLVSWLVVTDAERVEGILDSAVAALAARDAEAALAAVPPDFSHDGVDRAALLEGGRSGLKRFPPRAIETLNRRIEVKGDRAEAALWLRSFPAPGSDFPYPVDTEWSLSLVKRAEGWRIVRIDLKEVAGQPAGSLRSVLRQAQ